jgi:hypothetical protein
MKTLINIDRNVWGKLKEYATVKDLSVSHSVELLLSKALQISDKKESGGTN